jgi:hypothetical protein
VSATSPRAVFEEIVLDQPSASLEVVNEVYRALYKDEDIMPHVLCEALGAEPETDYATGVWLLKIFQAIDGRSA